MRHILLLVLMTATAYCDDFRLVDGRELKNVTVNRVEPDGLIVETESGIEKIAFSSLPKDVQEKFGYDPQKEKSYQKQKADLATAQAEEQRKVASDAMIWEPYAARLRVYEKGIPAGEEKKYQDLKKEFETVQKICQPLLTAGVDKSKVSEWIKCASEKTIATGMPGALVLVVAGSPEQVNSDSSGSEQWVYAKMYVYVKGGLVTFWQASN